MSRTSRQNVSTTTGGNIALAVVNAAGGVILARLLGPSGRGDLAAIQLWGFLFATIGLLGIPEAVVYRVARRREEAGAEVASATILALASSLVAMVVGYLLIPIVLHSQSDEVQRYARLFLLVAPLYALVMMPTQALRGLGEFRRWNILRVLPSALWLGVIAVAWATDRATPGWLTVGYLTVTAASYVVVITVAWPKVRPPYRVQAWRWRPSLRFGLPVMFTSIPQTLNFRLDQLLLAAFVAPRELGLYVAAVAWSGVIGPVVTPLGLVLFPRLAGEPDAAARTDVLRRGVRLSAVLSASVSAIALVVTPVAMRVLFGSAFVEAVPAALILVAAGGVTAFNVVVEECFRGLGKPSDVLRAEVAGLVATGALLALLLPPLGIVGAAIASVGGYGTTTVVLVHRLPRADGGLVRGDLRPTRADVVALVTGLGELVRNRAV